MKKFKPSDILKPVIVLTAICLITSALLAFTNDNTLPKIKDVNDQRAQDARQEVLAAATFDPEKLHTKDDKGNPVENEYFIAKNESGEIIGYVFTTTAKSYGGKLEAMVGVRADGTVNAVKLLQISDTPGLGMKANNENWLANFKNKVAGITVNKNKPAEGANEIQAITSATVTSKAVTAAVNTALENFATVTGGANNG